MAAKMTIQTRTQLPVYTAETLAAKNPVLLKGEVVYESDTRKHKVGDGIRPTRFRRLTSSRMPRTVS